MAAAKDFNVVVLIAAVLSELDSIFTLREKPENRTEGFSLWATLFGESDWSTGRCIITVQVLPPLPNIFYGLFAQWICEINLKDLGIIPSANAGLHSLKES